MKININQKEYIKNLFIENLKIKYSENYIYYRNKTDFINAIKEDLNHFENTLFKLNKEDILKTILNLSWF